MICFVFAAKRRPVPLLFVTGARRWEAAGPMPGKSGAFAAPTESAHRPERPSRCHDPEVEPCGESPVLLRTVRRRHYRRAGVDGLEDDQ